MIRNFGFLISLLKQLIPTSKNFLLPMPAVKNFYHNNSFSISFSHTHPAPSYQDVCISTHCDTMRSFLFLHTGKNNPFLICSCYTFNKGYEAKVKKQKQKNEKEESSKSRTKFILLGSAGTF